MAIDGFSSYKYWLSHNRKCDVENDKSFVRDSFESTIMQSVAYQHDALRNGIPQPIVATRKDTNKCKVIVLPDNEMFIGDLIQVFNEYWLCMKLYTDEYGMTCGELWLCNQTFRFQGRSHEIIEKHAIIDSGAYSKGGDKALPIANNSFTCYMSIDEESLLMYVDKRLAIDTIYNANGEQILDVGKIIWLDTKSKNFGAGSHLLAFGLGSDVYNKDKDNLELEICDFYSESIEAKETEPPVEQKDRLVISGKDTIRIGTGRTYKASVIDSKGNSKNASASIKWLVDASDCDISLNADGTSCKVSVGLKDSLIGTNFCLRCIDLCEDCLSGEKNIGVTSIG